MLRERFKVENKAFRIEQQKAECEVELCTNDEHVIAKMYELLLKFQMEEK